MSDPPVERFTALPWIVWLAVSSIVVTSTTNVLVLAAVAVGCWVAARAVGGPRSALSRVVAAGSWLVAAAWVVLGIGIHREGLGGRVVWILPSWSAETGGAFGGPVTVGQLHAAAARGIQAVAIIAMLGLLARAVSAQGWMRLSSVVGGRASAAVDPLLSWGEAYVDQHRELVASRASGLAAPSLTESVAGLVDRAIRKAAVSGAPSGAGPGRGSADGVGGTILGAVSALAILVWWAVGAIGTGGPFSLPFPASGLERTVVALAMLTAVGAVLRGGSGLRPGPGDLLPLASAAALATAWYARHWTGEEDSLAVDYAHLPSAPVLLLVALAVLPLLALADRGRR